MKITIAHLYPELLNIYGDRGNILAFSKRCEWTGIEVEVVEINPGQEIDPGLYDFYFIGGGQDQQQLMVADELQRQKDNLTTAANSGAVFLCICGGYQLLGHYYQTGSGDRIPGISILDAYTIAGNTRYIGNVTAECDYLADKTNTLVGFENHSGLTYIQGDTKPMANVIVGNGNNGKDKTEGARHKNVFGTYLHGSLLPKNPHFTDYLITLALQRKYGPLAKLDPLDDSIELLAHNKAIKRKY